MFTKKVLLVAFGAMLMFPFQSDAQLFKRRAERKANQQQAPTIQAPATNSACIFVEGQCIVHSAQTQATTGTVPVLVPTGDYEMDAYMARLYGVVPAPAEEPVSESTAVTKETPEKVDTKTALNRANAKLRMLNKRAEQADKAAAEAMIEAELARAQQIEALKLALDETGRAMDEAQDRYDAQIQEMLNQLAELEPSSPGVYEGVEE